ncbi:MAG: Rpn family recombination-promoting nuclease/putative transposase [Fibromonadaceae bacterium]|nr:Rpn family recombination-promoting nuclease/putative transposase [Fibromonadaceae bacterium]
MSAHQNVFAPLTMDFMFKRAFGTEKNKHILISLINTFLGRKMKYPVEDVILINTVQTPKTEELRGAVFDLHCQDTQGNRFIVEMQLAKQMHFLERIIFYISQAIVGVAEKGSGYDYSLPRIYVLCFLDFVPIDMGDIGDGDDESVQYISLSNEKHPEIRYPYINIAFAILPKFTKTETQCETILDWWLFLFKNMPELEAIPPELLKLSENTFQDLFEAAKIAKLSKEELMWYDIEMKRKRDAYAVMQCAIHDSREEVLALMDKGYSSAEIRSMLAKNDDKLDGTSPE